MSDARRTDPAPWRRPVVSRRAAARAALLALGAALLAAGCDRTPAGSAPIAVHATAAEQLISQAGEALQQRHYNEAIALFESALSLRADALGYALLGDCYWSQWKHGNHDPRLLERANAEYLRGLALDPNHCGLNHATGRDLVLLGRPAEALPYLDAARTRCLRQSLEAQNLWFRIQALVALGRVDEAKLELAAMAAGFPGHRMTGLAGRLLAETTRDPALLAQYPETADAAKK